MENVKRRAASVIVAVAMGLGICAGAVVARAREAELTKLITDADAIVAAEILRTDYTATAADGPMYGEAKILKVIKGRLTHNSMLRFGASGWWSPTYKAGERRIIFLQRVTSKDYYSSARWATLHADGIDFFFSMDSIDALSGGSLRAFLRKIEDTHRTPLKIQIVQKEPSVRILSVTLINESDQPIWLNPSRVTASFEANNIHYSRDVKLGDGRQRAWVKIVPAGRITGTVRIASREVKGTNQIMLWVVHRSVYFPNRCWVGTLSALVRLGD